MKKKIIIATTGIISSAIPAIAITSCSAIGGYTSFTGIGSNSVSPLIKEGKYGQTKNIVAPYSYDNSGSGAGFGSQVSIPTKSDFGMSSSLKLPGTQDKKYGTKQEQINNWAKNHIKTVTWAIDAIGVGVNLPSGITTNGDPQIDATYLSKVYNGEKVNWNDLLINEVGKTSKEVIPIYIQGGTETSGKSEAFIKGMTKAATGDAKYGSGGATSLKKGYKNHRPLTGNHGYSDSFTDLLKDNNNKRGSVMYYSLGQIASELNDKNSTNHSNIKLAAVKGFGSDTSKPDANMVKTGTYNYTRPFNIMYDVTNFKSLAFASWLLSAEFQKEVDKLFVSLPKTKVVLEQSYNLTLPDFKINANSEGLYDKPAIKNANTIKLGLDISNLGKPI